MEPLPELFTLRDGPLKKTPLTPASEISMPPLSSLSLSHQPQSPPAQAYQNQNSYFTPPPPQPLARQPVHSPAEAQIQSWAGTIQPQQPKPIPPVASVANMGGVWNPEMGINFNRAPNSASLQGAQQGGKSPSGGTWDPASGIRFG